MISQYYQFTGNDNIASFEKKLRTLLLSAALLISALAFIVFGSLELLNNNWLHSAFYFAGALLTSVMLVILRSNIKEYLATHIFSAAFALVCIYLIFSGTQTVWTLIWALTFPVIAVFLLSLFAGTLFSALVFAALEAAVFIPKASLGHYTISTGLIITSGYLIAFTITLCLEWSGKAKIKQLSKLSYDSQKKAFIDALSLSCKLSALHHNKRAVFKAEHVSMSAIQRTSTEALKDIFIELVQNAVTHGIEAPEIRRRIGKDETGTVIFSIYEENDVIKASLKDDGCGIDINKIKAEQQSSIAAGNNSHYIVSLFEMNDKRSAARSEARTGLNIVCSRLIILQGKMNIKTCEGKGTAFNIEFTAL